MEWRHLHRARRAARKTGAARTLAALVAASALAPLPAAAAGTASAPAQTVILDPVTAGFDSHMMFGQISTAGTAGTVVLNPSPSPGCATTGGLIHASVCKAARFIGIAPYQAEIRIKRPNGNSITMTGPGGATMTLDSFEFGSASPTTFLVANGANTRFRIDDLGGAYAIYAGATLHVAGNQTPGTYTGTFDVTITFQ
jgi:hypothetical protein